MEGSENGLEGLSMPHSEAQSPSVLILADTRMERAALGGRDQRLGMQRGNEVSLHNSSIIGNTYG